MLKTFARYIPLPILFFFTMAIPVCAQEARPDQSITRPTSNELWNGFYGKIRLSKKLFWDAQFHYRRMGHEDTDFVGKMGKIYNRHALSYLVNKQFSVSLGPVLRLNFTPDPGNPEYENVVLEPRIWHEYMFAMPLGGSMIYHRLRIEHRWSRGNEIDADWIFRNRWRYKFYMNIPLNNDHLIPGTFFFTPDVEIILQSGKPIIDSPVEDLRINPSFGYILNPRVKYTIGAMYTTGQSLSAGYNYTSRWVIRTNVYISLDFRKKESRFPEPRMSD